MYEVLDYTAPLMPADKPRYLMGVGTPDYLIEGAIRVLNMFDCVPSNKNRKKRYSTYSNGRVIIRDAKYSRDFSKLDPECDCYVAETIQELNIRHLLKCGEVLGLRLTTGTTYNFLINLMKQVRQAIMDDRLASFRDEFI
jgi:queuine tRNA-ribosyltransferase